MGVNDTFLATIAKIKSTKAFLLPSYVNNMDQKKIFNFHHYQETAGLEPENDRKWDENQPKSRHEPYPSGSFLYVTEIDFFLQIIVIHIKWHQKSFSWHGFEDSTILPPPLSRVLFY